MIIETISRLMGELSCAIRPGLIMNQCPSPCYALPSPEIVVLQNLRMAFTTEAEDGFKISPARVKWLTGNDTITGRTPFDKFETHFKPSHTLFLLTNNKPYAPADDFAFWERMILFPFELSFVDREPKADNELKSDLWLAEKLEKILPEILAWMVRGCLEWQKDGRLIRPAIIEKAVNECRYGKS